MGRRTEHLTVGRRHVTVSNLDKVLYPGTRFTKAKVIDYYAKISSYLLPHLKNHPVTLKRFPEGVFGRQGSRRRFVIQKHAASHLHYDFRLELHDVLKSWSVPKGPPFKKDERRLAMPTEDHPIEYLDFEGIIPKGQYGGGTVLVWDIGTYELIEGNYYKGLLRFYLNGTKLKGEWTIKRFAEGRDERDTRDKWHLIKTGKKEEIIGKDASKFFIPEDRAKGVPEKELATAALEGRAEDERWHLRSDGSRFWASGIVTPVRDQSDQLIGFSKVMRDMTERNKLTEERDRFFALTMDMLCIVHLDGRFQRVNPAFQKVLGFSEEEVLARSVFELVHPDDRSKTINGYANLSAGQSVKLMENRLGCKDGTYRWVAWSYFPVPEDGLAFGVGRDITDLRRMHEMLRVRADDLENANRVKDEFLATMSHELRTPLTSILGWSRLLDSNQLSEKDKERAIHIIQRNAEAQSKLIEDLLDVSRIITGKLRIEFQPVSFAAITDSALSSLRPAIDSKQLQLDASIDPAAGPISGDPARLQQIVTNLLSNAIKFTPNSGKIVVSLERKDAYVRLDVKDTGVGIAPEHLPHIFERFRQVESSNIRTHGGLGLGLAIVDYLVRQQGGTVFAASEGKGKGATFSVEFPLTSSEVVGGRHPVVKSEKLKAVLDQAEATHDASLQHLHILVVEDDADTQELLKTVLERHGAGVTTVSSGSDALDTIAESAPDVIISDIGMAGENGYDLIRKIRSMRPNAGGRIPAIALTAYAGAADRRRALLAGFQTHLAKPVEPDDLLAVILSLTFQQEP